MAKTRTIYALDKHLADMYLLATDILLNLSQQRHGYKIGFYYTFNPTLEFLQSDGSAISQLKLLDQLQDKDVLSYKVVNANEVNDSAIDFLSFNARRFPADILFEIELNVDNFNKEYKILSRYEPLLLLEKLDAKRTSKWPIIDVETGDLYIPNVGSLVNFKVGSHGFNLSGSRYNQHTV
jgi:hypothetical protein